jgi:RNA polymerase sigma factor (sigma-70 family)
MDGETTSDLVDLIERLRQGDDTARRRLLERAHDRVVKIAATIFHKDFARLRAGHDLESVVSETWIRLSASLEAVQPRSVDEFFGLVILRIRQVLLDMARREGRIDRTLTHGEGDAPAEAGDSTYEPARLALLTEFHTQVEGLVGDERRVFELIYYGGLTQAEIARITALHPRKISRLWFSATRRLAEWADAFS